MKGVSAMIVLLVAAVIIIVAAVIVLGIFTQGSTTVSDYFELEGICRQQGASICGLSGSLPPTWASPVQTAQGSTSCSSLLNCNTCKACNFPTAGS